MSLMPLSVLLVLAIIASHIESLNSAKILAMFPFDGRSQYICVENYLKALAKRGHEVTVISAFPQKQPLQNFTDVTIHFEKHIFEDLIADAPEPTISKWQELNWSIDFLSTPTRKVLEHTEVQKWLQNGVTFDLLIVEALQQEALYALAYHFKALLIGVSTFGTDFRIDELVGNTSPISYIPSVTSHFTDRMNFRQRLENLYVHIVEWLHNRFVLIPLQYELYKKYVRVNPPAPFIDVRKNFSLLLLNQHFSVSISRPYVPNAIEVAGWHIDHKPSKLPFDMEAFINASPKGAIYFSLGSNIRSKNLSEKKRAILMEVFASLPYNILWKFEVSELPEKPKNVYISKWFPQSDLLAHPNVKLFITHGGLLSTIEAIHYAKPVVGMAIYYDQHLNVARAQAKGIGLGVDFRSFTADQLKSVILEVLSNSKYTRRVEELSRLYHDQPMKPLQTAIYWTEYVLRYKGAPHMRVAAQELSLIEYHNLDTIVVLFGGPLLVLLLVVYMIKKIVTKKFTKNYEKVKST
ncbi:UDP-glucosyltransferase 2-like [Anastrepha ludens]|uniref:UDP-glucosyltransferase 2-like n=1 Tax=Anastrepha ludens TaxID=28586 RepID=UPI0023AEA305|nr:UDP-glucosyltransferase 2-like [Anastrepha ludens]